MKFILLLLSSLISFTSLAEVKCFAKIEHLNKKIELNITENRSWSNEFGDNNSKIYKTTFESLDFNVYLIDNRVIGFATIIEGDKEDNISTFAETKMFDILSYPYFNLTTYSVKYGMIELSCKKSKDNN